MKHMRKTMSLLLALCLLLALLPAAALSARADGAVSYRSAAWDAEGQMVVYTDKEQSVSECTVVGSSTTTWSEGWYVVKDTDITIEGRVTVTGDVKLILCDGATLTAKAGITVSSVNSLTIFAQSEDETKMGTLYAGCFLSGDSVTPSCGENYAGIGGDNDSAANGGAVTIHGGTVIAVGGSHGAGIGGGFGKYYYYSETDGDVISARSGNGCSVTVYNGSITATGGNNAAGIGGSYGGGAGGGQSGEVNIYGGTVTATGSSRAAGIGGGSGYPGGSQVGDVSICGGTVIAVGGERAAGIGGAEMSYGGTVTISGKKTVVMATGGSSAIGGGTSDATGDTLSHGEKVINSVTGLGWTNTDGTGDATPIEISTEGRSLNTYKRVLFNTPIVTFDGNGATEGMMGEQEVPFNEETQLNEKSFVRAGYDFKNWKGSNGKEYEDKARVKLTAALTLTAQWEAFPATAPNITAQPSGATLIVGYTTGATLTVKATAATDTTYNTLTYQWYSCDDTSKTNPQAIDGATSVSYTVPTGKGAGSYYYYCVVTAMRTDNSQMATAASSVATVTVKTQETQPNATFTATGPDKGTLSGLQKGMVYGVYATSNDTTAIKSVTINGNNTSADLDGLANGYEIRVVQTGNGTTTTDSEPLKISITQAAKPNLTPTQPDTINGKGSIPTTAAYQKSTDGTNWTDCDGPWTGLAAGTYYVRVKANGTALASNAQSITITAYTPGQEPTPNATFTATGYDTGTLSGVTAGMTYAIDGDTAVSITGTSVELTGLAPCTITVIQPGNGTTTTDSLPQSINVTRAATPTLTATQPTTLGGKGSIPTTAAHQKSTDGTTWTDCDGPWTGLAAGTYYVRVKASGTTLASGAQSIVITDYAPDQVAAPTFDTAPGSYVGSVTVTISCATPGASVYVIQPDTSVVLYESPITLTADTELKAYAAKENMLDSPVVTASYTITAPTYTITVTNDGHGTGKATPASGATGTKVTLTHTANEGYHFKQWQVVDAGGGTLSGNTFTIGTANAEIKAVFEKDAPYVPSHDPDPVPPSYTPIITPTQHGTVTVSLKNPARGDTVTITATPDAGYAVGSVTVTDAGGKTIAVKEQSDGTYQFTQPDGKVTITASFAPIPAPTPDAAALFAPFSDLDPGEWYAPGVAYVLSHGIMHGMGGGRFAPNATTSRAQLAQMLFNLDGATASGSTAAFADVSADSWYADAVTWMVENGIAHGKGESFGANDPITREQLAVMLYNYAQYKGYDVSVSGDVSSFPDAGDVNGYAQQALAWAVGAGIISGTVDADGNIVLDPQGSATRAQVAAMFQRFCENVAK